MQRLHWIIVQNYMSIRWLHLHEDLALVQFIPSSFTSILVHFLYIFFSVSCWFLFSCICATAFVFWRAISLFSVFQCLSSCDQIAHTYTEKTGAKKNMCEPKQSENGFQLFEIRYRGTLSHILFACGSSIRSTEFFVLRRRLFSSSLYCRIVKLSNADTAAIRQI